MDLLSLHPWAKEEGLARRTTSHHHAWVHAPADGTIQWRSRDVYAQVSLTCQGGKLAKPWMEKLLWGLGHGHRNLETRDVTVLVMSHFTYRIPRTH